MGVIEPFPQPRPSLAPLLPPPLQDLDHRRRSDPSNDIGRALALKAAAAKVCGAAAVGMSAGASGGEAVAIAKGEDKAALLQRLRQQVCLIHARHIAR
jgi:hypothetical protein